MDMRKLVLETYLTLDGVMQAPGDPEEDTEGGFTHGGWQMPLFDNDAGSIMGEVFETMEALLLGRLTYQIFAAYWPTAPESEQLWARKLNTIPKYVVSTTLDKVEWNNATLIKGNVAQEVARLKQMPGSGDIVIYGSSKLVQTLMQHNLIDVYDLWIHPLVLGSGKRLFTGGIGPLNLKLINTRRTGSGVVILTYEPAGK